MLPTLADEAELKSPSTGLRANGSEEKDEKNIGNLNFWLNAAQNAPLSRRTDSHSFPIFLSVRPEPGRRVPNARTPSGAPFALSLVEGLRLWKMPSPDPFALSRVEGLRLWDLLFLDPFALSLVEGLRLWKMPSPDPFALSRVEGLRLWELLFLIRSPCAWSKGSEKSRLFTQGRDDVLGLHVALC